MWRLGIITGLIKMAFVYKYVNKKSGSVDYVGMVKSYRRLFYRISEHEERQRFPTKQYVVYATETKTVTDAIALESHLIYLLQPMLNKAQKNYGKLTWLPNGLIDGLEWKAICGVEDEEQEIKDIEILAELIKVEI